MALRLSLPATLRTPMGWSGAAGLLLLLLVAVVTPSWLHDAATTSHVTAAQEAPSSAHWLGTDALGRDVAARVLVAARKSLLLALAATLVGALLGLLLGTLPVVLTGRTRRLVVAVIDFAVAFPGLLLALFLVVIFGTGERGAALAIGVSSAPFFARLAYTLGASIAGRDFIAASRLLGVSNARLLARHVLPNVAEPIVFAITITIGANLQAFAALSFLGLGVQAPSYDWGQLLNEGLANIYVNPAEALGAAAIIILAGVSFSSVGEVLSHRQPQGTSAKKTFSTSEPLAGDESNESRTGLAPVLRVEALHVGLHTDAGWIEPVRGVSFEMARSDSVGIVGESGSGKSLTALAIAGLLPAAGAKIGGRIIFAGRDLLSVPQGERNGILGTRMSMIFQDPMTTMNPTMRVGRQLAEIAQVHSGATRHDADERAVDRLSEVRIPGAARRAHQLPHEMSGGMRQRAVIAMGLMETPDILIADEPTTALDVTVQRQVLDLLDRIRERDKVALILISHDIGVIAQRCNRVLVMYGGKIVEGLTTQQLLHEAAHPYTRALLASVPELTTERGRDLATIPGQPPDPAAPSHGCPFAARCAHADARCDAEMPGTEAIGSPGHTIACWHPRERSASLVTESRTTDE